MKKKTHLIAHLKLRVLEPEVSAAVVHLEGALIDGAGSGELLVGLRGACVRGPFVCAVKYWLEEFGEETWCGMAHGSSHLLELGVLDPRPYVLPLPPDLVLEALAAEA